MIGAREAGKPTSAGIVLYRWNPGLELLIAHPGGPFWRHRDLGAWSIPKGLLQAGEDPQVAVLREFAEETGLTVPAEALVSLGSIVQRSGKTVHAWAAQGDADVAALASNTFTMEWPRGSGSMVEYPEMDAYLWAPPPLAHTKLNRAQRPFIDRLAEISHAK